MIEVTGADQLADLARKLKAAGDRELQRELGQAINRAVRPVKQAAQESARATLPNRGGLADAVAGSKFRTRRRTRDGSGVRVVAQGRYALGLLNQGKIRHRRKGKPAAEWTVQQTTPGWWSKPTEDVAPAVRRELERAMDSVARRLSS